MRTDIGFEDAYDLGQPLGWGGARVGDGGCGWCGLGRQACLVLPPAATWLDAKPLAWQRAGFSKVKLVTSRETGQQYACKVRSGAGMGRTNPCDRGARRAPRRCLGTCLQAVSLCRSSGQAIAAPPPLQYADHTAATPWPRFQRAPVHAHRNSAGTASSAPAVAARLSRAARSVLPASGCALPARPAADASATHPQPEALRLGYHAGLRRRWTPCWTWSTPNLKLPTPMLQ